MDTLDGFFTADDEGGSGPPPLVRVVENVRLPADGGLTVLGVLMSTVGSALALVAATYTIVALLPGGLPMSLALVALLSLVRSAVHARAGRQLVEQGPRGADALKIYALVAGLQTAIGVIVLMTSLPDTPIALVAIGALALMAWPLLLLVLTRRGEHRKAIDAAEEIDARVVGEDRGMTALGIVMLVGGVLMLAMWVISAVSMLMSGVVKAGFVGILMLGVIGLFGVRAWFGLRAGRAAMTRDPRQFMERFDAYHTLSWVSIVLTGVIAVITALFAGAQGLIAVLFVIPILLAGLTWPRAINHYVQHNLPEVSFQDPLPAIRRPRDAGLTGLGAVLLATGLPGLLLALAVLASMGHALVVQTDLSSMADLRVVGGSAITFIAGWSLFNMTPRFQAVAVVYGVVAGGLGLWSAIESLLELSEVMDFAGPQVILMTVLQAVLVLTIPLTTLWLALRHEEVGQDAVDADLARAFD